MLEAKAEDGPHDILGRERVQQIDEADIEPRVELLRNLRERAGARRLLIRVPALERDWTVPLREEVGLPHFSYPEHKLEYDPQLLRDELAEAGWEMGEPRLNWGEIWVEASAR